MASEEEKSTTQKLMGEAKRIGRMAQTQLQDPANQKGIAGVSLLYIIFIIFALYLSFKCQGKFDLLHLLAICCCPYIYIPWALVIGCKEQKIF